MNANLWTLVRQASNAVRLRFQPAEQYAYGLPVFIGVMLATGVANTVVWQPLFGDSPAAYAFGTLAAVTRWLVLTRALAEILRRPNEPRIPFLGYTLATEALVIPVLFLLPFPELRPLAGLWTTWTFWAQFAGAAAISGQRPLRVAGAYLAYWIASFILMLLFLQIFVADGLFDAETLRQNMERLFVALNKAR